MGVEFWSTSFAAPEPSLLNLLVELVGNYPPMPLITEKTVRLYFSEPPRRDSLPVRLDSRRSSSISVARSPSSGPRSRPTPAAVPAQIRPPRPPLNTAAHPGLERALHGRRRVFPTALLHGLREFPTRSSASLWALLQGRERALHGHKLGRGPPRAGALPRARGPGLATRDLSRH